MGLLREAALSSNASTLPAAFFAFSIAFLARIFAQSVNQGSRESLLAAFVAFGAELRVENRSTRLEGETTLIFSSRWREKKFSKHCFRNFAFSKNARAKNLLAAFFAARVCGVKSPLVFSSLADEMNHAMRYSQSEQSEKCAGRGATKKRSIDDAVEKSRRQQRRLASTFRPRPPPSFLSLPSAARSLSLSLSLLAPSRSFKTIQKKKHQNSYVYPPNGSSLKPFASSRSVGRDTAYISRSSLFPGRYDFLVTGGPEGRGKGKATVEFVTPRRRMRNDTAAALKGFLETCCDVSGNKDGEDNAASRPCSRLLEQQAPLADAPPLEIPDYCSMPGVICAR